MPYVWVHGCDPGRVSDGSDYTKLSFIECPSIMLFFWHVLCVIVSFYFRFLLCLCFHSLVGALY